MASRARKIMKRRLVSAKISTVISISLVLFLVGVAALLLVNSKSVSDYFKENMQVSVILKQDVPDEDAKAYESKLAALPCIKSTSFISREQGLSEMKEMLGEDFLKVFETAPVPVSIDVTLKADYVSPDSLDVVRKAVGDSPLVDDVIYQTSLVDALNSNMKKISLVIGVFILLLLFISFVLINNMVRLNVLSRRFTIHTMQLVGATKRFIRSPFMVQAVFQGLFAAFIAILLLTAGLFFLRNEFAQLFSVFRLEHLLLVAGIVVLSGLIICTASTFFVVNRLIGFSKDELYSY